MRAVFHHCNIMTDKVSAPTTTDVSAIREQIRDSTKHAPEHLFEYQKFVYRFMSDPSRRGILLYHSVGSGKCMAPDTPVLMADGYSKKAKDIQVGDYLVGDAYGTKTRVMSLAKGVDSMYDIWSGSCKYTVNSAHILCLKAPTRIPEEIPQYRKGDILEIPAERVANLPDWMQECLRGYRAPVELPPKNIPLSGKLGYLDRRSLCQWSRSCVEDRHAFVRTCFDQLGRICRRSGQMYFITKNKDLVDEVMFACHSSGILAKCKVRPGDQFACKRYRVCIYGVEATMLGISVGKENHHAYRLFLSDHRSYYDGFRVRVKKTTTGPYCGFTLDGNGRYLLGDCTVTHNTLTSIAIAEMFRQQGRKTIVLSSKSLRVNYEKELDTYAKMTASEEDIKKKYTFITSNSSALVRRIEDTVDSNMDDLLKEVSKHKSLEGTTLLVDEAHNLVNSMVNGSKTANQFYDMVMRTKDIKIVLMTGTPIINNPFEIAIMMNMLKGDMSTKRGNRIVRKTLFPENPVDFKRFFVDPKGGILNRGKFMARIFPMVSCYGDQFREQSIPFRKSLASTLKKENYPDRLPIQFKKVEMSLPQCEAYLAAREIEMRENAKLGSGVDLGDDSKASTSYRVRSRLISNVYPEGKTIEEKSPKTLEIIKSITSQEGIHLVYSNFLDAGIKLVAGVLEEKGFSAWTRGAGEGLHYAIFSGEQDAEEKAEILAACTSADNAYGERVKVLLISKSGTEGLDLKCVRHIHIMEPYWNMSLLLQIIARGVRYKSHVALPDDKKTVSTTIYMADYNSASLADLLEKIKPSTNVEKTTDVRMITNAIKSYEVIEQFLNALTSASIECKQEEFPHMECFKCMPTNTPLYTSDLEEDMASRGVCKVLRDQKAIEFEINGRYYYVVERGDVFRKSGKEYVPITGVELEYVETYRSDIDEYLSSAKKLDIQITEDA